MNKIVMKLSALGTAFILNVLAPIKNAVAIFDVGRPAPFGTFALLLAD
jgi:hypothetical protein